MPGGMLIVVRMRFGRVLRRLREEQGISQEEAAARCKLHRTYYRGIVRGVRTVSILNIAKIAKSFKMDLSKLFERI